MKKLGILACAALASLCTANLSAAVESDIVGYITVKTSPGFNMLGCVFNGLNGQPLPLNEVVSGDFQDGDEIQVYSPTSGYTFYTYWKDFGGWLDGGWAPAIAPVAPGTAFWLKTPGRSIDVTLKGAVANETYTYVSKAGFQMIAAALPVSLDLNAITWEGLTDGDEIQVRENGNYTFYTYWKDFGGWVDGGWAPVTKPLPSGASAWLKTAKSGAKFTVNKLNLK